MKKLIKGFFFIFITNFIIFFGMILALANGDMVSPSISADGSIEVIGDFANPYGNGNYQITQLPSETHKGIDCSAGYGAELYAISDAIVYQANRTCEPSGGYLGNWCPYYGSVIGGGNYVVLKFSYEGKDYYVQYAHLSEVAVSAGQIVKKGQLIGQQGHSGNSTGSHLHFEIHTGGVYSGSNQNYVDPRSLIKF